jgi:hypothetical protein
LGTATAAFDDVVEALSRIRAEEPVGDAAAALGQLLTAESCRKAQAGINEAFTAAVESVREYSESLDDVVRAYATAERAAADEISSVDIPS